MNGGGPLARVVRCGLIQTGCPLPGTAGISELKEAMIEKHRTMVEDAGRRGVQILCLQELFNGPYFPAEQNARWYDYAERIPEGPTICAMRDLARKHRMVIIAPVYEEEMTGVYYNTAAVIGADGELLGKYRKNHIPHIEPGFYEKLYFKPGNLGYPVFRTEHATIGVYICYDRHFPEGARILGLNGAEIVFIPSATTGGGHSDHLWRLEQTALAVANGYYVGTINRVGREYPWNVGDFYGSSYFCDPKGQIVAQASQHQDELLVADLDLELIGEVRKYWQFYRDRRPETYARICE
jgi:beta-ureidopropionase